jgi:DNA-binding response OmpR family regulator
MLKVLIAEDDLMIADLAEEHLIDHGYEVCGIARTVDEAVLLALLHMPDLAVIDLRLADGGLGTEIAVQLTALTKLGILYATGNMAQILLTATDGDACLAKPYRGADLVRGLEIVAELVATGKAIGPFPRGFQVLPGSNNARRELSHG